MLSLYEIMTSSIRAIVHGGKKNRLRQLSAFVLCIALLVNTFPMDAWAAQDEVLSQEETLSSDETLQDAAASSEEMAAAGTTLSDSNPGENAETGESTTEQLMPEDATALENNILPGNTASVSMSDPGLMSGIMMAAPATAASTEQLLLNVSWPAGYNTSNKVLTLQKGTMSFGITTTLSGSTVDNPILKITIPDCMSFTDYPRSGSFLAGPPSISGKTLTYRLSHGTSGCSIQGIQAKIEDGFRLESGKTYSITTSYYDGDKLIKSSSERFTTSLPLGNISINSIPEFSETLQENKSTYLIGPYSLHVETDDHAPYTSFQVTAPLPKGAVPYLDDHPLEDGKRISLTSVNGGFEVTYNGSANNLVYNITDYKFLDGYYGPFEFFGFNLEPNGNSIYLGFTNPEAKTYSSPARPSVSCTINGKNYTPKTSSNLTTVTFIAPSEWEEVRPNDPGRQWEDILPLKDGESEYDTKPYIRKIYASPEAHVAYDSLKMTVPLPDKAVPGFGTADSFEPLEPDIPYDNGRFQVTYYQDKVFSCNSEEHTANMLVYEIHAGDEFLISGSQEFTFSGNRPIHLRFTDPEANKTYRSETSPQIEVTRKGSTTIIYPHNDYSYLTTVATIEPPPDVSGFLSAFDQPQQDPKTGWTDTITLQPGKTTYDTRCYDRRIHSTYNPSLLARYPYDWIRMTVLLPEEATPGFGSGSSFKPLEDGTTYTVESLLGTWKVTYQENYNYSSAAVSGTAKALIYELDSSYSSANILVSTSPRSFDFSFTGNKSSESLYLRFENPELTTYRSEATPKLECQMDGKQYVAADFSQTYCDTAVTFQNPKINWNQLRPSLSPNQTVNNFDYNAILPEAQQNDKVCYGSLCNYTGYPLKNVTVLYTFDDGLNVDQLTFDPEGDRAPSNAEIVYTTRLNGTERSARLDTTDNSLVLEHGDAFLTARITYDSLKSGSIHDYTKILTASLHNYEEKDEMDSRLVTAEIISADSDYGSSNQFPYGTASYAFYLKTLFDYLSVSSSINPSTLRVEQDIQDIPPFKVTVTTAPNYLTYIQNFILEYPNLGLYLRMPKGYMLTGYTPPQECRGGDYTVTSRVLENGDTLYCLKYTDGVPYKGGDHVFSFRVGPEADFSTSPVFLPREIYAAVEGNETFQFDRSKIKTESEIGLDVNGDGDMEDSFLPCGGNRVTIRKDPVVDRIVTGGYLSTEGQSETDYNKEYGITSRGNYRFIIHNDPASINDVSDGVVQITLPEAGDTFTYKGNEHIAQYSVLLTDPVRLQGSFMESASTYYSTDGSSWLTEAEITDYSRISHIRIETAEDHTLKAAESAYIELSFSIDPSGNETLESSKINKTFIGVEMNYLLKDEELPAYAFSELTVKPAHFSGTVYQDRNWNGKQDADEFTGNNYSLSLYSGTEVNGMPLQNIATNGGSGSYSFDLLLPGTYTLHVEKDESELYGASVYFDENGNYTFTIGRDAPAPATSKLDMGILAQEPLELAKPEYQVTPSSPDGNSGWYITLPQVTLLPMVSFPDVNTMFWHDNETEQKLTGETRPAVEETGIYSFKAYNQIALKDRIFKSETATLDLKVDVDAPTISSDLTYSAIENPPWDAVGGALRVYVSTEDVGSGVDMLYYTLPGEAERFVGPDADGNYHFDIPMNVTGNITYYVKDQAGNPSITLTLEKNGPELQIKDDLPPVWDPFALTGINGNPGVRGADGGIWFAESVNASAQVTDADSGLARVTSRINGGSAATQNLNGNGKLTTYAFTATVETEGTNLLWAEAEDNAANTAETQTSFGIDRTAPVIVLENKLLALALGEPLLVLTSEEQLPAMATEDASTLADDIPTATVLIRDTGSGVDPDSIHVLWQGQETEFQMAPVENGYRLTFPISELAYLDSGDAYLITAEDYTGWYAELLITRYQEQIIYVAADTGSDVTGDGSRTYPVQTLEAALERVRPGGMIVLLENYNGTAYVNLEVTLDLNGKVLHSDVPGSAVTVGPAGSLTIMDSNGLASKAEGFGRDPESEGEIFGGIPGDPAFTLEGGSLSLTDGTIYCGYTGNGAVQVLEHARMMYLLTYLNGGGTGEAPGLHYIEENTTDALKQNTFSREGYTFHGWLYEDHLYTPGQEILMPGRNMVTLAKWEKKDDIPEETEESRTLDTVPKTGNGKSDRSNTPRTDNRMELYIKVRKKEDEQNTEN